MKHLRIVFGLALIPLCTFLGSLVPLGAGGNGGIISFFLGIAISYLFFTYGPGHPKNQLPSSYYLNHHHQMNGGANQQVVDINTTNPREAVPVPWEHSHFPGH